jgi:hypothetical protein
MPKNSLVGETGCNGLLIGEAVGEEERTLRLAFGGGAQAEQ